MHNCVQRNCDTLPIEVKALGVEVYKYFHIYTISVSLRALRAVRRLRITVLVGANSNLAVSRQVTVSVTELQSSCDEADIAYKVVLQIRELVTQGIMIIFCLCKKYKNLPENAHFN
jgi:hypothetical protein